MLSVCFSPKVQIAIKSQKINPKRSEFSPE